VSICDAGLSGGGRRKFRQLYSGNFGFNRPFLTGPYQGGQKTTTGAPGKRTSAVSMPHLTIVAPA
jgi:hypothetical protein